MNVCVWVSFLLPFASHSCPLVLRLYQYAGFVVFNFYTSPSFQTFSVCSLFLLLLLLLLLLLRLACLIQETEKNSNIVYDKNNTVVTTLHRNIRVALTGSCTRHISCSLGSFRYFSFICHEHYWRLLHKLRGNDSKVDASRVDSIES